MYFYDPNERETKELAPGIIARTFWGEKMLTSVVDLAPHTTLPAHSHPHEQHGFVVSGRSQFVVDGQEKTLTAGDVYVIPGDIVHSAQTYEEGARVVDIFAPVREAYKY
jgi:quercetin dioxygenase-like cupin family protein